ncbi:hypothetical protein PSHT_11827 [Puccinia striiformis]|uniref:Uncharacterized protein n=2 Tax=Puccinia striiformis TaxID=27350 RepID=A0A2S4V0L5_9BASI|nr:hypothetical protein PSHT_11827 [Puccinia striiformis]POW11331.1 hypothetical protein PSTT_05299 [Puccinia striiformis]
MCNLISQALWYLQDVDNADSNRLANLSKSYESKILTALHFKVQKTGIKDYVNPVAVTTTLSSCTKAYQNPPVALTWCSMRLDGFDCNLLSVISPSRLTQPPSEGTHSSRLRGVVPLIILD